MKKIISLCAALVLILSFGISAMAETNENILEISYVVYDKEGDVKEFGIIPNLNARYSWSGITLENGESVSFKKKDGTPFKISSGTRCEFKLNLSRKCKIHSEFLRSDASGAAKGTVRTWDTTALTASLEYTTDVQNGSYFYWRTENASSDAVTIKKASFTF